MWTLNIVDSVWEEGVGTIFSLSNGKTLVFSRSKTEDKYIWKLNNVPIHLKEVGLLETVKRWIEEEINHSHSRCVDCKAFKCKCW